MDFCLIPKGSRVLALPCSHARSLLVQCHLQEVPPSLPVPAAWTSHAGRRVGSCRATAHRGPSQASPAVVPGWPLALISIHRLDLQGLPHFPHLSTSQDLHLLLSRPLSKATSFWDPSFEAPPLLSGPTSPPGSSIKTVCAEAHLMITLLTGGSVSFLIINWRTQEGSLSFRPVITNISN